MKVFAKAKVMFTKAKVVFTKANPRSASKLCSASPRRRKVSPMQRERLVMAYLWLGLWPLLGPVSRPYIACFGGYFELFYGRTLCHIWS